MSEIFNNNYLLARSRWIDRRLSELPVVRTGQLRGVEVIRKYSTSKRGKSSYNTYFPSNPMYESLKSVVNERLSLISEQKILPHANISITPVGMIKMTDEKWDSIQSSTNTRDYTGEYYHNGIRMRSRFELLVASVLDSLNLKYKYEVSLKLGGGTISPDFLVYLPELGMCFVIECLGMVDSSDYTYTNGIKISKYLSSGYVLNRDLILLCGTRDTLPDASIIRDLIVLSINFIANMSVSFSCRS